MIVAEIENVRIERFMSYSIDSTLDRGADTFSLEAGMGADGENAGVIETGQQIKITSLSGQPLLVGIVDTVTEGETLKIEGRDLMELAIDNYPDPKRYNKRPPLTVLQEMVPKLAFTSVNVSGVTESPKPAEAIQIEAGESYCDVFQELAEQGNFEMYVDPLGNFVACNFPDRPPSVDFDFKSTRGFANCKTELSKTNDDCYGTIKNFRGREKNPAVKTDSDIAKYASRTITVRDGESRSKAEADALVAQMFAEMKNRMRRWKVTFGGPHEKFGQIPKIGDGAQVTSYRHGVTNEIGTIWGVTLRLEKEQGHLTEVTVRSLEL